MKASIELLKKCLRISAEAHHAEYKEWDEDQQIGIMSDAVPMVADARSILCTLCGNSSMMDIDFGCITVYLDEIDFFNEDVNEDHLRMALPYGVEL